MSERPYPEGSAWDEAWRQRQRADALEKVMPDLLEACELMIDAMVAYEFDVDDCPTPKHRSLMKFARNAVAKAKGETE